MGEMYSHSKLWLYENCPEAYKMKYVDKVMPKVPFSVHAFLGSMVHESLEWLHKKKMDGENVELDELIRYFSEIWEGKFEAEIKIPEGEKLENFFNKGIQFLIGYYKTNFPFADETIFLEKRILFPLSRDVKIIGFVDRVVKKGFNEYEVHDYKTNRKIKTQSEADRDRQLAFYHLGLKNLFGEDIKVSLVWHFLAHDKKVFSSRSEKDLEKLKLETLELIEKIKNEKEWSACGKPWCDWCSFKKKEKFRNKGNFDLKNFI